MSLQEVLILAALYAAFGAIDLYPLFKRKAWNYLRLTLPVYAVTFVVNVLVATKGVPVSITTVLEKMLSAFVK